MNYSLRYYQTDSVNAAEASTNGICVLPTGSGKSLVIAGIVTKTDGRTLVLQPTKEILESNYEKIIAAGFNDVGIFSASMGIKEVGKCTYATIGSIIHKLDLFAGIDTLIIDEAHLVNSKGGQYEQLIKTLQPRRLIGLTATPYRLHTTSFGSNMRMLSRTRPKLFEQIIYIAQTADLVKQGFLMRPHYEISGVDQQGLLRLNSTGAEFSEQSVNLYLLKTNISERVVEAVKDAAEKGVKHVLVFVPTLEVSAATVDLLRKNGITADSVSADSSKTERERKLRDFKSGEIFVTTNVGVLTTGYDFPALDCVILGRPTASLSLYYQMIGRCVRPCESKSQPLVYDLVNNFSRFNDPMDYHILESAKGLHAVLSSQGRLTNRIIGAVPECEEPLAFGKFKNTKLKDIPNDYLDWYLKTAKKSETWHSFSFELLRRKHFESNGTYRQNPDLGF